MFSHKKELIPLLFNSISTVSGKVERLISFDIAKRWYLRDIAERMYTSESLIKKKLQDENTCFSKILLASEDVDGQTITRVTSNSSAYYCGKMWL